MQTIAIAMIGFEQCPLPVQKYVRAGVLRVAYMIRRGELGEKAQTVAIMDRKTLKHVNGQLGENEKAKKETGEIPIHGSDLIALYAKQKALQTSIKAKCDKAGCGPKVMGEFNDAIGIRQAEETELLTEIVGSPIEGASPDPAMLAKVVEHRAKKRKDRADKQKVNK